MATVRVHGQVITRAGTPAPAGTSVRLRTWSPRFDYPEAASSVDELGGLQGILVDGAWRTYAEYIFGKDPAHVASTAADGSFAIEVPGDLPSFRLEATSDFGFSAPIEERALAGADVAAGLTLVLEPAGRVEGTLRGPGGAPPKEGRVMVRGVRGRGFGCFQARCDKDGRFEMRGVKPGRYEAVSWGEGLGLAVGPKIEVRAHETSGLDLLLDGESWIAGTVVDDQGRGVAGAFVRAQREEMSCHGPVPPPDCVARTDGAGAFRLGSLGEGVRSVSAARPGLLQAWGEGFQLPSPGGMDGVRIVLERGRSLSGRVVDPEGRPVAGASVYADTDTRSVWKRKERTGVRHGAQSGKTAGDGTFHLEGLPDAPLFLDVSLEGKGRTILEDLEAGREDLAVTLRPCGVAGTVREAGTERPVAPFSVEITVQSEMPRRSGWTHPRSFESADGCFEWPDLAPGLACLHFRAKGFVPVALEEIEIKPGEVTRGLDVRLPRGAEVRGRVVEARTGIRIAGARLGWSTVPRSEGPFALGRQATSGADGAFLLPDVAAGRVRIEVDHEEFVPAADETLELREGDRVEGMTIEVARAGALEGVAIGPDGSPLAGGTVQAGRIHVPCWRDSTSAEIGADGRFRIGGLAPGMYQVEAWVSEGEEEDRDSEAFLRGVAIVEAGKTTRVEFREPAWGNCTIRGKVLQAGVGLGGASVWIEPALRGEEAELLRMFAEGLRTDTKEDGSYEIPRVPAGEATLKVERQSFPLRVPERGVLDFDVILASGAIEGRVTRASDGAPVEGASVWVGTADGLKYVGGASADEEGRFRADGLPPGSYFLGVSRTDWLPDRMGGGEPSLHGSSAGSVRLEEGEVVRADIVLREAGKVRVSVSDPEGKPKDWAQVRLRRLFSRDDPFSFLLEGNTSGTGSATATGLAPGRYLVQAMAEGFAPSRSEEVLVAEGRVVDARARLRPGTLVRIRVVGDPEVPLLGPNVQVRDAEGWETCVQLDDRRSGLMEALAQTHLAPGEYTVLLRAPRFGDAAVPLRVGEVSPQEAVVRLEGEEKPR